MLDVHGGDDVDSGIEELHDVFPALSVTRAGNVRVRELVDDRDLRVARDDRVDVHLLERHTAILDLLTRNDFDVANLGGGVESSVRLDEANDYVNAARPQLVRLGKHSKRLSDAR